VEASFSEGPDARLFNPVPDRVKRMVTDISEPTDFFSGKRILEALAPDNIVVFHRSRMKEFLSSDVSNNYHHRFELLIVIERGGPIRIGKEAYRIEAGEAFLVFPNQFHLYSDIEADSFSWLFFTFNLHRSDLVAALQDSPRKLDAAAFACLDRLLDAWIRGRNGSLDELELSYRIAGLLRALLACPKIPVSRCRLHQGGDRRGLIMEQINAHVRKNLGKSTTISELSESLGYSVSYVRAIFRERLGVSLGKYIRESRLSEAAQLLQEPAIKVTDVAERCGFESLVVFSRAFKKTFGISPKDYSKMVQLLPHLRND
jgi:AraC-like DNA-binding protein